MTLEFRPQTNFSTIKARFDYREELAGRCVALTFNVAFHTWIKGRKLKKKKEGGFFNDGARDAINRTRGEGEGDTNVSHQHIIPWEYSGGGGTR